MMNELKQIHPHLYRRVRLKAITLTFLGLSLIFAQFTGATQPQNAQSSLVGQLVGYDILGVIFVVIGMGIFYGILKSKNTYQTARRWTYAGFMYCLFWFFVLAATVLSGKPATSSVLILWAYFTYNLFYVSRDPAWTGIRIYKHIKAGHDVV